MNKITIVGRMGEDPQVRQVKDSRVTTFSFAETSSRKDADGKPVTNWFRCTVWGKLGENAAKYLHKGDGATLVGDLLIRTYKDKAGADRTSVDVTVTDFAFGEKNRGVQPTVNTAPAGDDDLPF